MKLIIDISEELHQMCKSCLGDADCIESAIANGIPLDSVKEEIREEQKEYQEWGWAYDDVLEILDNIGKSCNTCKNSDDEFSSECYECVKNIQNHYEAESEE